MSSAIENMNQITELWTKTYNTKGKLDWSHILPYYADDICFKESIQEIEGIDEFREMTERLAKRSQELYRNVVRATMQGNIIFINGRIGEQRDYYDLWGDILDNIPVLAKSYGRFMKKKFG